ncbi:MAG: DUF4249 family protein [Rhodothermaceae bacterium]|nr:DUF4249 family protein [Rhodothermaceae bacterium]
MRKRLVLATAVLLLFSACSETVETRLEIEYPFSVFGIINPKTDTHAVRIFEIKNNISVIRPEPIDATVRTIHMQTGDIQVWRDSVIQLEDGDFRHVYWSAFEAEAEETYHLVVERSDGAKSEAITTVPPPTELILLEPDTLRPGEAFMPLLVRGSPPTLPRVDVEYILVGFNPNGSDPIFKPLVFNYAGRATPESEGFLLNIDLREDYLDIYRLFDADNDVTPDIIDLREMHVTVHVGDAKWVSPVGVFDEDFLVEPGIFSNVENGFGYFGSGYTEVVSFRPPLALLRRAGFYVGDVGDG